MIRKILFVILILFVIGFLWRAAGFWPFDPARWPTTTTTAVAPVAAEPCPVCPTVPSAPAALPEPVAPPAPEPVATPCLDVDVLVAFLNAAHSVDPNGVAPVLAWLDSQGGVPIAAGQNVGRSEDGFIVFWTPADVEAGRFTLVDSGGVAVAFMGGASGTVLGFYDTGFVSTVDGKYLTSWCLRLNPVADLTYWGE